MRDAIGAAATVIGQLHSSATYAIDPRAARRPSSIVEDIRAARSLRGLPAARDL